MLSGFFLIDKPIGPTSHDVVGVLRRISGERTIGHAGTLDPLASGLLIVAIGREFTKQIDKFKNLDKIYEAEVCLGEESNTYDREGSLTAVSDRQPSEKEIKEILANFVGAQEQLPPIFSAKKIKGESAYKSARAGRSVELKPVSVNIKGIDLISYHYPKVVFSTEVSAGTYIRSLAHDIGKKLGIGAYLFNLRRVSIGGFSAAKAIKLDEIRSVDDLLPGQISSVV